jgi:hypothetical protein
VLQIFSATSANPGRLRAHKKASNAIGDLIFTVNSRGEIRTRDLAASQRRLGRSHGESRLHTHGRDLRVHIFH